MIVDSLLHNIESLHSAQRTAQFDACARSVFSFLHIASSAAIVHSPP